MARGIRQVLPNARVVDLPIAGAYAHGKQLLVKVEEDLARD